MNASGMRWEKRAEGWWRLYEGDTCVGAVIIERDSWVYTCLPFDGKLSYHGNFDEAKAALLRALGER